MMFRAIEHHRENTKQYKHIKMINYILNDGLSLEIKVEQGMKENPIKIRD